MRDYPRNLSDLGSCPIAGDSPAGRDETGTERFSEVAGQIARIDLNGVRGVEWGRVIFLGEEVLRKEGKNIRMGAYLAYGLYEMYGLRGLGAGLEVISNMTRTFWTELYPPPRRMRGRIRALEWLCEKAVAKVGNEGAGGSEEDECRFALTQAEDLAGALGERTAEAEDAIRPLVRVLRLVVERILASRTGDGEKEEGTGVRTEWESGRDAMPEGVREVSSAANPASSAAAGRVVREIRRAMLDAARALRAADASDPRAYLLLRIALWLPITEPPPSADGRTDLPPPPRNVRVGIEASMTAGDFGGALSMCENAATDSVFWLGAHRICAQALNSLGHETAAEAVRVQIQTLLQRLPMLERLSFSDGTPFVDPATLDWLESMHGLRDERDSGSASGRAS